MSDAVKVVLDVQAVVNYINDMPTMAATPGATPAEFLAELGRCLAGALRPPASLAHAAAAMALAAEAKRARPALIVELAALAGAPLGARLLDAAAMVELMHTASLVHDDIIDGAALRRGVPAVSAALGVNTAVLVGDDLLVRAFAHVAGRPPVVRAALATLGEMVHGVAAELAARGDHTLDEARWRSIAHGKTAALFGLCGEVVGFGLARPRAAATARLRGAGLHLGVAFQIADDVADLASGADLVERNPNLAVALAVAEAPALGARLAELWAVGSPTPAAARALTAAMFATSAPRACLARVRHELAAAEALLAPMARTPARRAALGNLRGWGEAVIERTVAVMNAPNVPNAMNSVTALGPAPRAEVAA